MNRQQEYNNLMLELENTPDDMIHLSDNTKLRARKRNKKRTLMPPIILLAMILTLTIAVNASPTVAHTLEQIPLIRHVALIVDFRPPPPPNVVQHINLEQTKDGIIMRVEYVIVDQHQLNIFYTLRSHNHPHSRLHNYDIRILSTEDGERLRGSSQWTSGWGQEYHDSPLHHLVVTFRNETIPDALTFEAYQYVMDPLLRQAQPMLRPEPEDLVRFSFELEFDPNLVSQSEILYVNQDFVVDEQRFTLDTVEIYPLEPQVIFSADPTNTASLIELRLHAEDEQGNRCDATSWIPIIHCTCSHMTAPNFLHSPFFFKSNEITIFISEVALLDKSHMVRVDLANVEAESLSEGVTLYNTYWDGLSWHVSFVAEGRAADFYLNAFDSPYFNEAGDEFSLSNNFGFWDATLEGSIDSQGHSILTAQYVLRNFPYDVVYFTPWASRVVELHEPIALVVR